MKNLLKDSYLLLIFFVIFIFKDSLYSIINIKEYKTDNCIYLKNMEENYYELLKFNDIKVNYNYKYVNTFVLYKDIYNYNSEITVLKGSKNGIKVNSAVIYDNKLVGLVKEVYKTSSLVHLLTNKNNKISVKINEEVGILEYDNTLKINGISNYGNISINDDVYTSGLGEIPESIYIGKVKDIILKNKKIEKIVYIDYDFNIRNTNYLTILIKEDKQ